MAKNRITAIAFLAVGIVVLWGMAAFMMVLGHGVWAALLLGASLIALGVIGLVTGQRPYPAGQNTTPAAGHSPTPTARQSASHSAGSPPATAPSPAPAGAPPAPEKITSIGIRRITNMVSKAWNAKDFGAGRISIRVMLIGSVVLTLIAVLLLCNLLVAMRPWFTVHETQVVECKKASAYTKEGWQVVSSFSYQVEDPEGTATTYTACVIERERFIWVREERAEKTKKATGNILEITPGPSSLNMEATSTPTPQASPTADALPVTNMPPPSPTANLQPTATVAPTTAPPTITPLPSATPRPTETPLPTVTPDPSDSPLPTPLP